MADLLTTEIGREALVELLSLRGPSADLPPPEDPAWEGVRSGGATAEWVAGLRLLAQDDCGRTIPDIPLALYAETHRGGELEPFESPYRERRRMLARAALCALLFPQEPVWADRVKRCIEAILAEPSWALPVHVRPPDGIDPGHIDPAAARTSFLVAQAVAALGGQLGEEVAGEALARLRRDIFRGYLERHGEFWWARGAGHNNAVCHHGILGAALAIEPDPGAVADVMLLARAYLSVYLRGFGSDGATLEGVARWEEGMACLVSLNDLIAARTIGQMALFSPSPALHEAARFGPRMMFSGKKLVNFGDALADGSLDPGLLSRLAELFADEEIAWAAERALADLVESGIDFDAGEGAFRGWAASLLFAATSLNSGAPDMPGDGRAHYFPEAALLVVRGRDDHGRLWEFAAKGGFNAEPYNHNDCGSYLLNVEGAPVVAEIGMPHPSHDYLHRGRYDYLAARTLGHSLPLVNGFEQPAGPQAAAKVLSFEEAAGAFELSLDLSACYPPEAACADLIRTLRIEPGAGLLEVREIYELASGSGYETALITSGRVTQTAKATLIEAGGLRFVLEPGRGSAVARVERQEYADIHGHTRWVSRIVLAPERPAGQGAVGYAIRVR